MTGWDYVVAELQAGDPQQIGSYRLVSRLGSGGMGRVFLARSPGDRLVAVKVIRAELAGDPQFRSRFAREVAAARRVSGIFTAPVVDADPDAAEPWLVTGYVDGPSLAAAVARNGPMPAADVAALGRGLAEGLAAIHAAGVVHRDLKPSNVLLARDGPRIIDFGISRAAEASKVTGTGIVVGSPGFMSPEQADGRAVGAASDVFSLGAVLAYAATGREPFGTGTASALLYRVVHADPALEGLPALLRPLVERCMEKDPSRRPSPGQLLEQLRPADDVHLRPEGRVAAFPRGQYAPTKLADPADRAVMHAKIEPAGVGPGNPVDDHQPYVLAGRPQRIRRWWIVVAALVILAGTGAGIAAAAHNSGSRRPPAGSSPQGGGASTKPAALGPGAVVRGFIAAINAHHWRRVWQLGGKNLGRSYPSMVAGFRYTSHDVLNSLTTHGNRVSAQIQAYETNGVVQTLALSYVVQDGVITAGKQTLLSTQNPGGP